MYNVFCKQFDWNAHFSPSEFSSAGIKIGIWINLAGLSLNSNKVRLIKSSASEPGLRANNSDNSLYTHWIRSHLNIKVRWQIKWGGTYFQLKNIITENKWITKRNLLSFPDSCSVVQFHWCQPVWTPNGPQSVLSPKREQEWNKMFNISLTIVFVWILFLCLLVAFDVSKTAA